MVRSRRRQTLPGGRLSVNLGAAFGPAILVWLVFYGDVLAQCNQILFASSGDGIKNDYTLLYHVLYGRSALLFEGMGYPYGEHILYTDNQPLLAITLQWISRNVIDLSPVLLGIVNGIVLISAVLAAAVLYGILRHYRRPIWYACLSATGIAFLPPPEPSRFGPLLAFLLPGNSPLLVAASEVRAEKILDYGRTSGLEHPLLDRISSLLPSHTFLFLGGVLVFSAASWQWGFKRSDLAHFAFQFGLPLLMFALFVGVTDPDLGQRPSPLGYGLYRATLPGILQPFVSPLGPGLLVCLNQLGTYAEGLCWVGVGVSVLLVLGLSTRLVGRLRRHGVKYLGRGLRLSNTTVLLVGIAAVGLCDGLSSSTCPRIGAGLR